MGIGYACLALGVPGTQIKSCRFEKAVDEKLVELINSNLNALKNILEYNKANGINLFRISSDIIPFASHAFFSLPWRHLFREELLSIGNMVKNAGMRVSMHPGQYTVLNSNQPSVVQRAVDDLVYHADFLGSLGVDGTNKIVLHIGGVYGDKKQSLQRFISHFHDLPQSVKQRLCIENDDRLFTIGDAIKTGSELSLPVVFDTLHHSVNPSDAGKDIYSWISEAKKTWKTKDGKQKIHYSQQDEQKGRGAHSASITAKDFVEFYNGLEDKDTDIMLEVKDKNLSAIKCMLCVSGNKRIGDLEKEWSRYKYTVLAKNPSGYQAIRQLLKDKFAYPAVFFYEIIDKSLAMPEVREYEQNAALHIWGYFKKTASEKEKQRFLKLLNDYMHGKTTLQAVKNFLLRLAAQFNEQYLLNAYYFYKL